MFCSRLIATVAVCSVFFTAQALFFARNMIRPYDRFLWAELPQQEGKFQLMAYADNCFNEKGAQWDHDKTCDVLQIYEGGQNTLAMVRGFPPESGVGQKAIQLNNVSDNGVRGYMVPYGRFHMAEFGFGAQYWTIHNLYVGVYVPFVHMSLNNVSWRDCTQEQTAQDYLTKDLVTNNFCDNICQWGGLNACSGWHRTGISDVSVLMGWERDFPQTKPILTDVRLSAFGGMSLPTGAGVNNSQLFSIPMGYDGAPGVIFGGRLRLTWKHHLVGGVEGDFVQLFGNTRTRRIKTDNAQSELLLLAKARTHMEWGFLQRYHLYVGGYNIMRGISLNVGYLFQKQGDSILSLCDNDYVTAIAQTSRAIKQWTIHTITVDALYNWEFDLSVNAPVTPRIGFYYQHDFRGRRAILMDKWGFDFGFSF